MLRTMVLILLAFVGAGILPASGNDTPNKDRALPVMTRNMDIQADARRTRREPCNTAHTEPKTNNTVVAALTVTTTAQMSHELTLNTPYGQTALEATRNACHPGNPYGRRTLSYSTGRNQAVACTNQAAQITELILVLTPSFSHSQVPVG